MKKLIAICLLFIATGLFAYTPSIKLNTTHISDAELSVNSTYIEFEKAAKESRIPHAKINTLKSAKNGYYIIAGVFGNELNAKKSVQAFQKKGFNANYIKNAKKGVNYVYLEYRQNGKNAINLYASKLEGRYTKEMWILVANNPKNNIAKTQNKKPVTKRIVKRNDNFIALAKDNKITTKTFNKLNGIKNGYYVIAGVYRNEKSVKKLVENFTRKSFKSNYIKISKTGLNYLYLEYHTKGENAINSCVNKLNGTYSEKVWIMKVEESEPANKLDKSSLLNSKKEFKIPKEPKSFDKVTSNFLKNEEPIKVFNFKNNPKKSNLIKRADSYFDKMWYADAATLYEQALEKNKDNYTFEIIQRAADSHYFNSDMEKAQYWYDVLYEQFPDEMSNDNIFKYAHSLRGNGKYTRSKRLMRLYDKKIKNGDVSESKEINFNEKSLDSISKEKQKYELKNMSTNTKYSDFSPMFLDSNKVVFASSSDSSIFNTRKYKWNNQPFLDLFVAEISDESDLRNAKKLSKKVNTKYHEASVTFTSDYATMYFTRNNYGKKLKRSSNGVNHLKIYKSKKVNDEWSEAVEVSFNSDEFSTGHPALSPDNKKLYFVSDRPGSMGQSDIFVVDVLENNTYSEPRNLGPEVNTERNEMFPFVKDSTLYFSSNGHPGFGGLDIFESAYTEEGGFQTPVNMGQPLNSRKDDFSYIFNEENEKGFFASNRSKGKGDDDIYSFKRLPVEKVPENNNAIAGVVTSLITGDSLSETTVQLLDKNGNKLQEVVVNEDGSYLFKDLDSNTKYTVRTNKEEFFEETYETETKDNELITTNISLRKLKEMIVVEDGVKKLKTEVIFFDFDKSYIRKDASEELDKLIEVMQEYTNMVIKVESHTDSRGDKGYNKYLSDKRAKSTREYIISKGIDPSRIESAIGYGEEQLLNECDGSIRCTEKQHFMNRRSEFIIVNM